MSGASAIATSKITNGSMISQSSCTPAEGKTQIMLPLELSLHDPSTKLECCSCTAWLKKPRKGLGASLSVRILVTSLANAPRLRSRRFAGTCREV
jgi:hypothetical protein